MKKFIIYRQFMATIFIIFITAFMFSSCATTTQVVLLPDADGRVGALEVSDPAGEKTQKIDQAWQSVKNISADRHAGRTKGAGRRKS